MIFSFIKFSLRHHRKHQVHALVNISGLALGITCFVMLMLLVKGELSYDAYHKDKDLIYQVYTPFSKASGKEYADQLLAPAGPLFTSEIPEVAAYVRFSQESNVTASANDQRLIIPKLYFTDPGVFDFFSLKLLTTARDDVDLGMEEIVISESSAIRLFGSVSEALGASFEFIGIETFQVSAVFEDLPDHSHLSFDYLISFEHVNHFKQKIYDSDWDFMDWSAGNYPTYIKLNQPLADKTEVEEKLNKALLPHWGKRNATLVPLDQIYFSDWNRSYFKAAGDDRYLNLYTLVAFIILVVAIVNYTNLSTASFVKRAKEVGIRKAIGGKRSQLIRQFLAETFVLVFVAAVMAVCLFEMALPYFNEYTGKAIGLDYTSLNTYLLFVAFIVLISVIAGIYPAFFLSAHSPKSGMNVSRQGHGRGFFRKLLVCFQFAACLSLMVASGIVFKQHKFLREMPVGFKQDLIVGVPLKDGTLKRSYDSFKAELLRNPRVDNVMGASMNIFKEEFIIETDLKDKNRMMINWAFVEPGFFELLDIELKQGQVLSEIKDIPKGMGLVVNEATVAAAGWEHPLEGSLVDAEVRGVVKDFIFGSAKERVTPLMFSEGQSREFEYAYVAITGDINATLTEMELVFDQFSRDYPFEYQFLDDQIAAKYESEKRLGEAFVVFSLITFLIAGLGVLGLSVFVAETRIKEIGIRKVLGAGVQRIIWLLNGNITFQVLLAGVVSLPIVYFFMNKWLQSFTFHTDLTLSNFLIPLFILLAAVWSVLLYHALKSAKANPVESLRAE